MVKVLEDIGSHLWPLKEFLHKHGSEPAYVSYIDFVAYVTFHKFWPIFDRYNVPRSFLRPNGNLLVLFEEEYGNPLNISLDTVSNNRVCGHVSDIQPHRVNSWEVRDHYQWRPIPRVNLRCPPKQVITKIVFASHGNPSGNCESYALGSCHSSSTQQIVEKVTYLYIKSIGYILCYKYYNTP